MRPKAACSLAVPSGVSYDFRDFLAAYRHGGGLYRRAVLCFFRGRSRLSEEKEESAFDVPTWRFSWYFGSLL